MGYHPTMKLSDTRRAEHHRWLTELTGIPTAAGRERRVIDWIQRWVAERPSCSLSADSHGNLELRCDAADTKRARKSDSRAPIYFTAHLDHPAFVVERIVGPATVELAFRGGVMDDFFDNARLIIHTEDNRTVPATLTERTGPQEPFKRFHADLDADNADGIAVGDIATWNLPAPEVRDGLLHAPACDDLAAAVAALAAYNELLDRNEAGNVRLLFTRAEEIGFVGAIGASRSKLMPTGSRILALENSRSFAESPIGGGPIVRVGDRISVFSPSLTDAVARRAEEIAGGPATPRASEKHSEAPKWKWQRKLMAGGACEASVFCAYGYESTCLCLPLGNYHNMADLEAVQAGTNAEPPHIAPEHIAIADFDGLVDLLIGCGTSLDEGDSFNDRIEKIWNERRFVLDEPTA